MSSASVQNKTDATNISGGYRQYLESLCRRRGWPDPSYECHRDPSGYKCLVLVNGREYQTDGSLASRASSPPEGELSRCLPEPVQPRSAKLSDALSASDDSLVYDLLQENFLEVAVDEYEWLTELQSLGYSAKEIADILLEKSRDGPCVFAKLKIPDTAKFVKGFHNDGCVHSDRVDMEVATHITTVDTAQDQAESPGSTSTSSVENDTGLSLSPLESIEYFCGIGGVKPTATGVAELQFGSLAFRNDNATAISSLHDDGATADVLMDLERAAGILQQLQGCCDSFSFLCLQESRVELVRVNLDVIRCFDSISLEKIMPGLTNEAPESRALAAQFLSLAFLSYSQAHCGVIRPFFLDTPLSHVILIGDQQQTADFYIPCIVGSLVELTCFGTMLKQQVFAFQYSEFYFQKGTLQRHRNLDLSASPEDILDTWGPGEFLAQQNDRENLYAISIGGGLITRVSTNPMLLHWSLGAKLDSQPVLTFHRTQKVHIGAKVYNNDHCQAKPKEKLLSAFLILEELGTFSSYWEVSERQLGWGLQAGQGAIALIQFNQTWVKRRGVTKKSKLLSQRSVYVADLEGYFGIQVSVCTGIARRIRLRDLLSDVLPAYVGALVAKPVGWKSLVGEFKILQTLKTGNLSTWLESLDYSLQKTFEDLVMAVLFLLQDTGVDRKGENFVIGCIQPDIPFRCFSVPCRKENYWARIVADSEDIATFAYMTTQCLETDVVKCQGPSAYWANSTALLWTAVSCCEEEQLLRTASALPSPTHWKLKHLEAYLIGKPEAPLLVRVDRHDDQDEPRLFVSVSKIRPDFLWRLYRSASASKPRRLRERGAFNQIAENVMVLTSTSERST
ncbi:hypothetical protein NPX13_g9933 [Xylaria arbuscula]|uniref:Uncharacterized protein n=1 Tax=Xylaria arbuscula TaxID=114810 RepID=A0A9W8TIE2_9PEZI|nr:hypothetical protein NPX13_g9933 [Xylaria arbuscula]